MSTFTRLGSAAISFRSEGLGLRVAQVYPRYSFQFSSFLAIYETWTGNNNAQAWDDLSGNGHHLLAGGAPWGWVASTYANVPAYCTTGDADDVARVWRYDQPLSTVAGDYTAVFAFRPSAPTNAYLALFGDDNVRRGYTYLVSSYAEPTVIYADVDAPGNNSIAAGQLTIMAIVLSASGASVYVNGQLRYSGLAYGQARIMLLLLYNQQNNYVLKGEHYAFALYAGTDADLRVQVQRRWAAKLGIPL